MPAPAMIRIEALSKRFDAFEVLKSVSLDVAAGEKLVICGPSGSGKSTLIRCINGLEDHQGGRIEVDGTPLGRDRAARARVRGLVGMVFQQFNLFPHLTVLENLMLGPVRARGLSRTAARDLAMRYLERVRIPEQAGKYPRHLSGGQQQRVAIARALTQQAEVILADEPIASLDPESARKVMEILADINRQDGKTVVVTLHQVDYALRYCSRAVALKGGRIHYDGPSAALSDRLLNDLYGADLDASLLFSDRARSAEPRQLQLVNG